MAETPKAQLDGFIAKFSPAVAKTAKAVIAALRKRMPGANLLVYDNYNALAVGFADGERVRDVYFSLAVYTNWVSLFFFRTLPLKDPEKLLKGSGSTTKHIVLKDGVATLQSSGVAALVEQALAKAGCPCETGKGKIVIKSVSARQRPRRPG